MDGGVGVGLGGVVGKVQLSTIIWSYTIGLV